MSANKTRIASVTKALNVLSMIATRSNGATAKEVAEALGMPAPTAYHLLNTLAEGHALTKSSDRRYRLGPRIGALINAYSEQSEIDERILTPMKELAASTGESIYLSGWRGSDISILAIEEGSTAVRVTGLEKGAHSFAHARASGKLLLAFAPKNNRDAYIAEHGLEAKTKNTITDPVELEQEFERIVEQGYSTEEEQFTEGVACIATPISFDGLVHAAYTISAPLDRYLANRDELLKAVIEAGERASATSESP